jgi:hypothetical protein
MVRVLVPETQVSSSILSINANVLSNTIDISSESGSEDLPLPSLEDRDEPLGMDLDDFLPETIQGLDEDAPAPTVDKFLEAADGVKYLKSSLVASLSTNRTKKVTMRTLRAQGVALEDLQKRKSTELDLLNLSDEDVIKSGDVVGTLFRSQEKVCLGVLMVKGFRIGKDKTTSTVVDIDKLHNAAANIRIIAQVMDLENPCTSASLASPATKFYEWTGNYHMLDLDATNLRMTPLINPQSSIHCCASPMPLCCHTYRL